MKWLLDGLLLLTLALVLETLGAVLFGFLTLGLLLVALLAGFAACWQVLGLRTTLLYLGEALKSQELEPQVARILRNYFLWMSIVALALAFWAYLHELASSPLAMSLNGLGFWMILGLVVLNRIPVRPGSRKFGWIPSSESAFSRQNPHVLF